ncbi:MAG TPA: aldehyde dehydrogenase family protein, partial [Terriglobales bacterium]|nr:aldehyde dehydrogenase family protein [Terriglobales bacterium]
MSIATPTQTTVRNYINGKWQASASTEHREIINPATNEVLGQVPMSGAAEVDAAVQAAARAFPEWRRTPPEDRIQYLFKLKNLLEENFEDLARTIT